MLGEEVPGLGIRIMVIGMYLAHFIQTSAVLWSQWMMRQ